MRTTTRRAGPLLAAATVATALAGAAGAQAAAPRILLVADYGDVNAEPPTTGYGVFSVRPDGRGGRRLAGGEGFKSAPAWSPNRRRVVFASAGRLFVMRANGRRLRRIRGIRFAGSPAWSPNGRRIAYSASSGNGVAVFTVRPDGRKRRRLTRPLADIDSATPDWSPNGRSLAYTSRRGIARMRANGRRKRLLIEDGYHPAWSPDGRRLAFIRDARLFVARADGSGARNLTADLPDGCEIEPEDCGREDEDPAWSPGGNRIAYEQFFPAGGDPEGIHTIRPDGSGDRKVRERGQDPDW